MIYSYLRMLSVFVCLTGASLFGQAPTAPEAPIVPGTLKPDFPPGSEPIDKRILGVLTNYRTANMDDASIPMTDKGKMAIAAKDSFDYPSYLLAIATSGFGQLGNNVRLFMVPGMFHCSGGPGPNNFGQFGQQPLIVDAQHDATTALEAWVEHGTPPRTFIATKFVNDTPGMGTLRTMPLCPFPAKARYNGGNVAVAASWSCNPLNTSLLDIGYDGIQAGLEAPLYLAK